MNRKRILEPPRAEEAGAGGKWIEARVKDGILVVDCFEKCQYIGRYWMEPGGRHEFYSVKDHKWHQYRLASAFQDEWYNNFDIHNSGKTDAVVREFAGEKFGEKYRMTARSIISWKEDEYSLGRRERAMNRKQERIDNLMAKVPPLPEGFEPWLEETVFEGREYWFPEKTGKWKCTACGKLHETKITYKNGQEAICRRTGKKVQVKSRQKEIRKQEMVVVFQSMDSKRSAARHFKTVCTWSGSGKKVEAFENVRYILGRTRLPEIMMNPLLEGKKEILHDVVWYYGQINDADEFEQEWWDTNPKNKRCHLEYCYPEGVREALRGTAYEGLHLETFARLGWKVHYNKIMINRNACGFLEYMAKAGLKNLTQEVTEKMSVWAEGVYDGGIIQENGKNAEEILGINMQRYRRLRQRDGGYRCLKWLRWEQQNQGKLPEAFLDWAEDNRIDPEMVKFIQGRMSPVQIMNYLSGQMREYRTSAGKILEAWKDYLSMAEKEGMEPKDSIVYRTKHLLNRHEELSEAINSRNEDQQAERMREKYPDVEPVLRSIKDRYEYDGSDFIIRVPETIRDILREGRALHHCVAASDRYLERISSRETYILFLRRKSRPLHSWYTLEVEPGGTVRQKRSEFNRQPDLEEVKRDLMEWQSELKKRLKEEDRKMAKRSRTLRMMEMREMREKRDPFAETLERDLMEVG